MENILLISRKRIFAIKIALMFAIFSNSFQSGVHSPFIVTYQETRHVHSVIYGGIECCIGIGFAIAHFLKPFPYFYMKRRFSMRSMIWATLMFCFLVIVFIGSVGYIKNNTVFLVLLTLGRLLNGVGNHTINLCWIESVNTWFPGKFQLLSSLIFGSTMLGFTVGAQVGASIYDVGGYASPHYSAAISTLAAVIVTASIIPDYYHKPNMTCTIIKREKGEKLEDERDESRKTSIDDIRIITEGSSKDETTDTVVTLEQLNHANGTAPLNITAIIIAVIPAVTTFALSLSRGYFVIFITPYIIKTFGISITQAGTYLVAYYCFSVIWFILCGYISQQQLIRHSHQAIIGSALAILGIVLLFPSPHYTPTLCHTYIVYVGVFLFSMGDSLNFSVTTAVMEQTYQLYNNFVLPDRVKLLMGSIAITFWNFGQYFGRFLGGLFREFVAYEVGAWIFNGFSALCFLALLSVVVSSYAKIKFDSWLAIQN